MKSSKKLQIFVSSTYQDLREERQAAVEAILTAGHIPAGMELFAAGDQSQMNVIKRWIDESDVFMLILGGRYGTVESESQKSYIHHEYDYAVKTGKPLFAVVITEDHLEEKVKRHGTDVIEREHTAKLNEFRRMVLSRMVKFWSDPRDIKLAVHETMAEFGQREDLVGWISGDQRVDTASLAEELARLAKENAELRERVADASLRTYNGLRFEQLQQILVGEELSFVSVQDPRDQNFVRLVQAFARHQKRSAPTLLDALLTLEDEVSGLCKVYDVERNVERAIRRLAFFGLVSPHSTTTSPTLYTLTADGKRFFLDLLREPKSVLQLVDEDDAQT